MSMRGRFITNEELASLRARVAELEAENAKLRAQLAAAPRVRLMGTIDPKTYDTE
jgi:cell division protein FtsB